MITRSRKAALNSPARSTNNQNNPGTSLTSNSGFARTTRRSTSLAAASVPIQNCEKSNDEIVKDVVDYMVDLVSKQSLASTSNAPTEETKSLGCAKHTPYNYSRCYKQPEININANSTEYTHTFNRLSKYYDNINETDDSDPESAEDKDNANRVEAITCEVSFDIDMSDIDSGQCPICGLFGRLGFDGYIEDRVTKVCSKRCADNCKSNTKTCTCASCGKMIACDSQGYLPNFGTEKSVLCSEECLLKFEKKNEPVQKCFNCKKDIILDENNPAVFYWQTMEFCSPECINNLQQFWGRKCANCGIPVPQQSLGKYSVRFGNVIKQFCCGSCLEQYKKVIKVCAYCQINLAGCLSICSSVTGGTNTKRVREFCDPICRSHYLQMVAIRNSANNNNETGFSGPTCSCCQCSRIVEKSSCLDVIFRGRKFLICSTFCLSAFKFSFDVTKIICESCSKYGWSYRQVNILHYSGFTKLFCSRKCLHMHVLKIRRIQSCLTCNVKKYNFDLVEKYDVASGDSKLFCSTYCYSAFELSESQNKGKEPKAFCDCCKKLARLSYHIPSPEKTVRNFCSYSCVLSHQSRYDGSTKGHGFDYSSHQRKNKSISFNKIDPTFKRPGSNPQFHHRQTHNEDRESGVSSGYFSDKFFNKFQSSPSISCSVSSITSPSSSSLASPSSSSLTPPSSTLAPTCYETLTSPSSETLNPSIMTYSLRSKASKSLSRFNEETESSKSLYKPSIQPDNSSSIVSYLLKSGSNLGHEEDYPEKTAIPSRYLNHSEGSVSKSTVDSGLAKNFADKSIICLPSRKSKATLCRPFRKDRCTQTEIVNNNTPLELHYTNRIGNRNQDIDETIIQEIELTQRSNNKKNSTTKEGKKSSSSKNETVKYIPVPIFVPFFVPIPVPIPSATLLPLPLPTPVPFGFPIDSRLTLNKSSPVEKEVETEHTEITDVMEETNCDNSEDISNKKPKRSHNEDCESSDTIIADDSDDSKTESQVNSSKNERNEPGPGKLKRSAQDFSELSHFKQGNDDDNYCDESDNCSNASENSEKTKRRRVTITTHG